MLFIFQARELFFESINLNLLSFQLLYELLILKLKHCCIKLQPSRKYKLLGVSTVNYSNLGRKYVQTRLTKAIYYELTQKIQWSIKKLTHNRPEPITAYLTSTNNLRKRFASLYKQICSAKIAYNIQSTSETMQWQRSSIFHMAKAIPTAQLLVFNCSLNFSKFIRRIIPNKNIYRLHVVSSLNINDKKKKKYDKENVQRGPIDQSLNITCII